jgi:hypothetical protein
MHRPGGYLVGLGPEGIEREADTFTCCHCNRVVPVGARERAADIGGFCRCCAGLICGPCVDDGRCRPLEKRLQAQERRAATLRSYGMTG